MNKKRAKWIRRLVELRNPVLFTIIRNKYGDKTTTMTPRIIYKISKKLWETHELQEVNGWPTLKGLIKYSRLKK